MAIGYTPEGIAFNTACPCDECTDRGYRVDDNGVRISEEISFEAPTYINFPFQPSAEFSEAVTNTLSAMTGVDLAKEPTKKVEPKPDFIISGETIKSPYMQSEANLKDFLAKLIELSSGPVSTEELPRGCRFYFEHGASKTYVIELAPDIYPLTWNSRRYIEDEGRYTPSTIRTHKLAMPWQYFIASFFEENGIWIGGDVYLAWSKERAENLNVSIFSAQIPNVSDFSICLGNTGPNSKLSLSRRIEALVDDFYTPASHFNADLGWKIPPAYNMLVTSSSFEDRNGNPLRAYAEWARQSRANKFCWMKWPDVYDTTLKDFLSDVLGINMKTKTSRPWDQFDMAMRYVGRSNW